jgi:catechol 2,3-dioxygenase-like lactoylglutathione lyase family enzyme
MESAHMLKLDGILESSIYTADLAKSCDFYEQVLELKPLFKDSRMAAYDAGRRTVFLIFLRGATTEWVQLPGGAIPPHDGHGEFHFAFAVPTQDLEAWEKRLAERGVAIEARTDWPRGGKSIYFRDPDNHLVELATPGLWATY